MMGERGGIRDAHGGLQDRLLSVDTTAQTGTASEERMTKE